MDVFHTPDGTRGAAYVFREGNSGANAFQPWVKPVGFDVLTIIAVDGGAGGGNGFTRAAGAAGGGGGGGGGGAIARAVIPLALLPDVLYVQVASGVAAATAGARTYVCVYPDSTATNIILRASNAVATAGGNGTGAAVGAAGAGATITTAALCPLTGLGQFAAVAGAAGAAGGAQTGAVGANATFNAANPFGGGNGGAGCTTTDFAGGRTTGAGIWPTSVATAAAGEAGRSGYNFGKFIGGSGQYPMSSYGGNGGHSNNSATAGAGGDGGLGAGGGGGGAGTTGGAGGRGGPGIVVFLLS